MPIIDVHKLLSHSTACGEWKTVGLDDLQLEDQGNEIWIQGSVKCSACPHKDNCGEYTSQDHPGVFQSVVKTVLVESCIKTPSNCRECKTHCEVKK